MAWRETRYRRIKEETAILVNSVALRALGDL